MCLDWREDHGDAPPQQWERTLFFLASKSQIRRTRGETCLGHHLEVGPSGDRTDLGFFFLSPNGGAD